MEHEKFDVRFDTRPNDMSFPSDNQIGLTKREYLAAQTECPQQLINEEIDKWRGDRNILPDMMQKDFVTMLKNLAFIEATYKRMVADALIKELNKQQS